jgi:hypothetical protein
MIIVGLIAPQKSHQIIYMFYQIIYLRIMMTAKFLALFRTTLFLVRFGNL